MQERSTGHNHTSAALNDRVRVFNKRSEVTDIQESFDVPTAAGLASRGTFASWSAAIQR